MFVIVTGKLIFDQVSADEKPFRYIDLRSEITFRGIVYCLLTNRLNLTFWVIVVRSFEEAFLFAI